MSTGNAISDIVLLSIGNYFLTTFSIWFGHWFSHLKGSPLSGFHMSGHHVIYLNSKSVLSEGFRYGSGKQDSSFALVPPLILQAMLLYLLLPLPAFLVCFIEGTAIAVIVGYIHIQIHVRGSKLEKFAWFSKARSEHASHHDMDKNFMVGDHFWDKCMGTYVAREPVRNVGLQPKTGSHRSMNHVTD